MKNLKYWLILIFCLIFFWFLFTFRLTDVPPGINGDEAAIGYNAALVARTGYDQSGRFLPIFISAQDLTDWKQPITFYSTVLAFKLLGPSYVLLREVSVIFVLISAVLIFLLGRELMGFKTAFVSFFIFITIPSVLIQSHLALENIAPVPFTVLWLLMLAKYKNTFKGKFLLLAGLSLGMSLFSYSAIRIIFPVFFFLSIGFIYYLNRKKNFRFRIYAMLKFSAIAVIFPLFMLSIKNQYPGAILAYNRPHNIPSYQQLILPYISSYDPSFLFIKGDSTPYHSTGKQGVFLLATLPFFILGITRIIHKKDPMLIFILLVFFFAPLLYGLPSSIYRASRLLVLLPSFTIISAFGLSFLLGFKKSIWIKVLTFVLLSLVLLNYFDFVSDYWYEYPKRVESEFARPIHIAFKNLDDESNKFKFTPLLQTGLEGQNPIAFKFFEEIYFQSRLQRWGTKNLPKSSVILADLAAIKERGLDERDFKRLELKNLDYYLLISR